MSAENAIDLVRWTFTVEPDKRQAAETYLTDEGAEVFSRPEGEFIVLWDEPENELDEVVEELWEVIGSTIEVTQETFRRSELVVFQHDHEGESEGEAGDRSAA